MLGSVTDAIVAPRTAGCGRARPVPAAPAGRPGGRAERAEPTRAACNTHCAAGRGGAAGTRVDPSGALRFKDLSLLCTNAHETAKLMVHGADMSWLVTQASPARACAGLSPLKPPRPASQAAAARVLSPRHLLADTLAAPSTPSPHAPRSTRIALQATTTQPACVHSLRVSSAFIRISPGHVHMHIKPPT